MVPHKSIVCTTTTDIFSEARSNRIISSYDSQLLLGEAFIVERKDGEWLRGHAEHDGYRGYIRASDVKTTSKNPNYFVDVLLTHAYAEPNFKTRPLFPISFLSKIHVQDEELLSGFVHTADDFWIYAEHLTPLDKIVPNKNVIKTALSFLNIPYLYGGRSALGLDCSGLIQIACMANGIPCPRDSRDQSENLGFEKETNELDRGDLVFFDGHVGVMVDSGNVLNATARHMCVCVESLNVLIEAYGPVTSVRHL